MAYRKRFVKKRRTFRKPKKTLDSKVKKIQRIIKQRQPEPKYVNESFNDQIQNTTSQAGIQLDAVAQGDTLNQRDGNMITPFRLSMKFQCLGAYSGSSITTGLSNALPRVRIVVVQDKDTNNSTSAPTYDEVFSSQLSTLSDPTMAIRNWNNRKRFRIIYDKVFTLPVSNQNDPTSSENQIGGLRPAKNLQFSKRLKMRTIFTTANAPDGRNHLYLYYTTDIQYGTPPDSPAEMNVFYRLLFNDPQ